MYTVDDQKNNDYEVEYVENDFWDKYKGLIVKIIIMILCVIVLIWLIKALNAKRNATDNGGVHMANVLKVRLASEDYFFIKNNNNSNLKTITLQELKNEGLISDIVDANNNTCDNNLSEVTLLHEVDGYNMTIKLACSTNDKKETFYYHNNTLACLNCNGETKMTGVRPAQVTPVDNKTTNDNYVKPTYNNEYSCYEWSDWSKTKVHDANLVERIKTLVFGVNYRDVYRVIYGEWSSYGKTPITPNNNLEVETMIINSKTLYRSRTVTRVFEKTVPIYTDKKYEENNLPNGYTKLKGTEEVYYSYKYPICEK